MRTFVPALFVALLFSVPSISTAAEYPKMVEMELTVSQCLDMMQGLGQLEGRKEGEPDKPKLTTYKFGWEVRTAIRKNMNELKPIIETYQQVRDDLIIEMTGDKSNSIKDGTPEAAQLAKADRAWLKEKKKLQIWVLGDLSIKENNIAATTLYLLGPVFVEPSM